MCGIVGIFQTNPSRKVDESLLRRMNDRILHRGPDAGGFHVESVIGLGHRRLSIIDLSTGQQPLYNEDGSVVVVFNGEIYNFPDLTVELKKCGHIFRTHSDTEVIVHAWEEWGEDCVKRFRGMFVFALWDTRTQTLFVARDRLGVKPLYYACLENGEFIFGSELKALLVHPGVRRTIDPLAVEDYFAYGYIPDPKTILTSVRKLPPAHCILLKRGDPEPRFSEYWDVAFKPCAPMTEDDAAHEFIERFRESVKIRMISEVPLGAFLSGGVDSSGVVAMMAGLSPEPINTCSIAFGEKEFNEAEFAQIVADKFHTRHYVEEVASDDFALLDTLSNVYDEPFADSSSLPTYRLCELARKRVTVALSGDGGDESFAGYTSYQFHLAKNRLRSMIPGSVRIPLCGLLGRVYPKMDWAPRIFRAKTTFETLAMTPLESFARSSMITPDGLRKEIFSDQFRRSLAGYRALDVLEYHAKRSPTDDPLSLVQYLDMKVYLNADILTKVDRASMAHGLEVRGPLIDYQLIDWVSGLPPSLKFRQGKGKYLLRKALAPHLPDSILSRKKKGFSIPVAQWLRGPMRERMKETIIGSRLSETGYFNQDTLSRMVSDHERGLRDHGAALWALLVFEAFLRNVLK